MGSIPVGDSLFHAHNMLITPSFLTTFFCMQQYGQLCDDIKIENGCARNSKANIGGIHMQCFGTVKLFLHLPNLKNWNLGFISRL